MWAIEDSPSPKVAYRRGGYHFTTGYTTGHNPRFNEITCIAPWGSVRQRSYYVLLTVM